MSRFFSHRFSSLVPYVPGEQPQNKKYVKLNTNESPFPPSPSVEEAAKNESKNLNLYSDPECVPLRKMMAEVYDIEPENVIMSNGSDEVLNFAFMAFADEKSPLIFPDITYGFYTVFADINNIDYSLAEVDEKLNINIEDFLNIGKKTIVIANPNAPTGQYLSREQIEKIVANNRDNIVIADEAYIDFGGESAIPLIKKYDNLLVVGTFSKSRSMAGARLGFGIADKELIGDLNTIKYSINPYNVNRMTMAAGVAALKDNDYYMDNCRVIENTREYTAKELEKIGFEVLPSMANFVFAKSKNIDGKALYEELKKRGVLVRHFENPKIKDYNRITIGTKEQMDILLKEIKNILEV